jgi:hypothetical protein
VREVGMMGLKTISFPDRTPKRSFIRKLNISKPGILHHFADLLPGKAFF